MWRASVRQLRTGESAPLCSWSACHSATVPAGTVLAQGSSPQTQHSRGQQRGAARGVHKEVKGRCRHTAAAGEEGKGCEAVHRSMAGALHTELLRRPSESWRTAPHLSSHCAVPLMLDSWRHDGDRPACAYDGGRGGGREGGGPSRAFEACSSASAKAACMQANKQAGVRAALCACPCSQTLACLYGVAGCCARAGPHRAHAAWASHLRAEREGAAVPLVVRTRQPARTQQMR